MNKMREKILSNVPESTDEWGERFARQLADAFRPFLVRADEIQQEDSIRAFLDLAENPPTEELEFSGLDCDSAQLALTRWCGILVSNPDSSLRASVQGIVGAYGRQRPPAYRWIDVAIDRRERCLSDGMVLLERGDYRCAIRLAYEPARYGDGPSCSVSFHFRPDTEIENEALVREFRDAVKLHDVGRNQLLVFDRTGQEFLRSPAVSWADIILPDAIIEEVRRNVLRPIEAFRRDPNAEAARGRAVLLSGPPGTGKTMIGKALATSLSGTTFLWVTPGGFDRASDAGYFFRWARDRVPAIVFFEDLDLVTGIRGGDGYNSILGEILAQMDGFIANQGLVVMATTNDPDVLDDALRRPGRFDRHLVIGPPAEPERRRILERLLADEQIGERENTLRRVAVDTDRMTGAHLRELVHTMRLNRADEESAERRAFERADFTLALEALKATRKDIGFSR